MPEISVPGSQTKDLLEELGAHIEWEKTRKGIKNVCHIHVLCGEWVGVHYAQPSTQEMGWRFERDMISMVLF